MTLNKNYGYWSVILGVIGTLLLILPYLVTPENPQGLVVVILKVIVAAAILLLSLGILSSILAIKKKEKGSKKYFGVLISVSTILFVLLIPIFMGIGFLLNDTP